MRSKQEVAIDADVATTFVQKFSGGKEAAFLRELESWAKVLSVKREAPSELLHHVSSSAVLNEFPLFAIGIIKSSMASRQKFAQTGVAKIYVGHDFLNFGKNREHVATAHAMQKGGRTFLEKTGLSRQDYELILGDFDVRLCDFVSKKISPHRKAFSSFKDIGAEFMDELKDKFGAVVDGLLAPFAKKAPASAAPSAGSRMREFKASGVVEDATLRAQGFIVGAEVVGPETMCWPSRSSPTPMPS